MKYILCAFALTVSSFAFADVNYPEMSNDLDTEQVFELSLSADADHDDCEESEKVKSTEWTCFARDARGGSLGVSTSFTKRSLAAGRAIASCQRKSSIPQTCRITRCRQPEPQCP